VTPPAKKPAAGKKAAAKKATRARQSPAARDRRVLQLRHQGKTFEEISKALRIRDVALVHGAYERALVVHMPETPDKVRRAQLDQVTAQEESFWPLAEDGDLAAIAALVELVLERQRIQAAPAPLESKRQLGPIETATKQEVDRLFDVAPALAATALVLARVADSNTDEPGHTATAARELRMHMSQLRGLAGTRPPQQQQPSTPPPDDEGKGPVATVTELDLLRQRAAERARERTSS
jgi:hypothetical protein